MFVSLFCIFVSEVFETLGPISGLIGFCGLESARDAILAQDRFSSPASDKNFRSRGSAGMKPFDVAMMDARRFVSSRRPVRPQPWELGLGGIIFGGSAFPNPYEPVVPLLEPMPFISGDADEGKDADTHDVEGEKIAKKRRKDGLNPTDADAFAHDKIIEDWTAFVVDEVGLENTKLGNDVSVGRNGVRDLLNTMYTGKPRSTLAKRLGSMKLYNDFCKTASKQAFPMTEGVALSYLLSAAEVSATSGQAFRAAVTFSMGYLGICGANDVLDSRSCIGAMFKGLVKKKPLKQTPPLSVNQVISLEMAVADVTLDVHDRVLAGLCCLCVHGRLRVGDALRIVREPVSEYSEDRSVGYLETGQEGLHRHLAHGLDRDRG